jgi:hypothetical protein
MKKLTDLRFVIGVFFFVVGFLLVLFGWLGGQEGHTVNLWCGVIFIVFSLLMFGFSYGSREE